MAADPQVVDPQAADPQAADPQAVDPQAVDEAVDEAADDWFRSNFEMFGVYTVRVRGILASAPEALHKKFQQVRLDAERAEVEVLFGGAAGGNDCLSSAVFELLGYLAWTLTSVYSIDLQSRFNLKCLREVESRIGEHLEAAAKNHGILYPEAALRTALEAIRACLATTLSNGASEMCCP